MKTPIADFLASYAGRNALRLHMPGHKGRGPLGCEGWDITEIPGADSLYEASGIILESERNASHLFGCHTLYSAEGSSLSIRAMLWLLCQAAAEMGRRPVILAGRNAHKAFLSGVALLDIQVSWLYGKERLSCLPTPEEVAAAIDRTAPVALYLTSPDYLGNLCAIGEIAKVCHERGVLLAVDNAHGAYLRFLSESMHPMDLGADICCDSAHKTLPVLTGGAYLHISHNAPEVLRREAKNAMALFGSTSPSYLILASLDLANAVLAKAYPQRLRETVDRVEKLRCALREAGFSLVGEEPMKLTLATKCFGYTGVELGNLLENAGIFVEFSDPDYLVFMPSVDTETAEFDHILQTLISIPRKKEIKIAPPPVLEGEALYSPREVLFLPRRTCPVEEALGEILADARIGCPPAVPILVAGERIGREALDAFRYYGISSVSVLRPEKGTKAE